MAHLLPRWHWGLPFVSLFLFPVPTQGDLVLPCLAAPKPAGKTSDALALWSMKGSRVSLPQLRAGSCLNSPEPSPRRPK